MHTFYYNGVKVFEKNDAYYSALTGQYFCKAPAKKGYGPPTQSEIDKDDIVGDVLDIAGSVAAEIAVGSAISSIADSFSDAFSGGGGESAGGGADSSW